jgi:hypothetical protein
VAEARVHAGGAAAEPAAASGDGAGRDATYAADAVDAADWAVACTVACTCTDAVCPGVALFAAGRGGARSAAVESVPASGDGIGWDAAHYIGAVHAARADAVGDAAGDAVAADCAEAEGAGF